MIIFRFHLIYLGVQLDLVAIQNDAWFRFDQFRENKQSFAKNQIRTGNYA